jgi:lysophospholipase L1-like esterase
MSIYAPDGFYEMKKLIYILLDLLLIFSTIRSEAQVINAGVGGNTTRDLLLRVDHDVINHDPTLVILMVGTNDMLNSSKMISYREYATNLEALIHKIQTTGCHILLVSPAPVDSAYLLNRHDRALFTEVPNVKLDSISKLMNRIALTYNINFLDLNTAFKSIHVPRHNEDLFIKNRRNSGKPDGVHPTSLGYHFIAESIYQFCKENMLLNPDTKIICFGDSITHGGGGTKVDNYPGYLSQRLDIQAND